VKEPSLCVYVCAFEGRTVEEIMCVCLKDRRGSVWGGGGRKVGGRCAAGKGCSLCVCEGRVWQSRCGVGLGFRSLLVWG
jgi:hypothetical protein